MLSCYHSRRIRTSQQSGTPCGEDLKKQEIYSLEKLVDEDCVPVYLWGTFADDAVPVENSLLLLNKLAKYRIPVEYHLFPEGVHGLSLATKEVEEPEAQRDPTSTSPDGCHCVWNGWIT